MSQSPELTLVPTDSRCPPVGTGNSGRSIGLAVEDRLERVTEREEEDRR